MYLVSSERIRRGIFLAPRAMHGGDDGAGFGDGEGDYILELAELELGADFFISGDDFLGTRDLLRRAKDGRLRGCTGGALFGRHGCCRF